MKGSISPAGEYCMYLRKSRADVEAEQKGEGETLARHESALLALAREQNLKVTQIYREIVSGETIAARPVMQQLLGEVEQGRWAGVLVMEIERLARGDTLDQGLVAQAFRYSGTRIITPAKTYNPNDEFDEEYFEFGLFMSRREYKMIHRRLQRGRLASVREGKYVGSRPPYGYQKVKLEREKGFTLEPVEEQAAVVRMIYRWYLDGVDGVRVGPTVIANKLTEMGIPPPRKGRWSPSTVRDIVINPVYMGKIRWNWRPVVPTVSGGQRSFHRPRIADYQLVDGLHPPIIPEEDWQKAQRLMQNNRIPKTQRHRALKNPLSGLVICGNCGNRMVRKPYRHGAQDSLLCATPGCRMPSAPLWAVEEQLLDSLALWLAGYQITMPALPRNEGSHLHALLAQLQKELENARLQKSKLHDLLERGIYDVDTFLSRSQEVAARIDTLTAGIQNVQRELQRNREREKRCNPLPEHSNILQYYHLAKTPAHKNALLKSLLEKVVYFRAEAGRWKPCQLELHLYPKVSSSVVAQRMMVPTNWPTWR